MATEYEDMLTLPSVREKKEKLTTCQFLPIQFANFETIHNIQSWEIWWNGHLIPCQWGYALL